MVSKFKITVLSENNSGNSNLESEHGISFLIEINDERYLFDTGASEVFCNNANKLNINCSDLTGVILSHGHYDHTGGLDQINDKKVYIHEDIFKSKYKIYENKYKYIGIPQPQKVYERNNNLEFIPVDGVLSLTDDIKLITGFKKDIKEDNYFFVKQEDNYLKDFFVDELVLTINTIEGLVIVTGCSHSGIINIVKKAIEVNNTTRIHGLFGGFHLSKLEQKQVINVANKLNEYKIGNIGMSHCTGNKLIAYLNSKNAFNFNVGDIFPVLAEDLDVS